MDKMFKNLDKMLSKNADLNMAIMLFLVAYLAFDIKEFVPAALNNEIVRVVVIAVAVYLLIRSNMGKINCSSHACTLGILLLLAAVLHRPNEGFLGAFREGFTGTDDEDVFSKYQVHIAERGTESHAEPEQIVVQDGSASDTGTGTGTGSGSGGGGKAYGSYSPYASF